MRKSIEWDLRKVFVPVHFFVEIENHIQALGRVGGGQDIDHHGARQRGRECC